MNNSLYAGGKLFVFLLFLLYVAPSSADFYSTGNTPLNRPLQDGVANGVPGQVLDQMLSVSAGSTIDSISVAIAMQHSWIGDLVIRLKAPDGTELLLLDRPGVPDRSEHGDSTNLSSAFPIVFDDTAATPAERMGEACEGTDLNVGESCPGAFVPEQSLSALRNLPVAGDWTLSISDNNPGDSGRLDGWGINVTTAAEPPPTLQGSLENPQPLSSASGIGLVSGWHCDADRIEFEIEGEQPFPTQRVEAAYGSYRGDTANVCGDTDNGFGLTINYNKLGDGSHTLIAYADGVEFGRATFAVTTLGQEFLRGADKQVAVSDFPTVGNRLTLGWQESIQNFVIQGTSGIAGATLPEIGYGAFSDVTAMAAMGSLENPQPGSSVSGISLVSGWVCDAEKIEFEFEGEQPFGSQRVEAAYGSYRGDTASVCGDTDNGFGLTINYNKLGNGRHTVIAYADNVEFARASFDVATLGVEFLRGVSKQVEVEDFPESGTDLTLGWQEASQNFVIRARESGTPTEPVDPSTPVAYTGNTSPAALTPAEMVTFTDGIDTYLPACKGETEESAAAATRISEVLSKPFYHPLISSIRQLGRYAGAVLPMARSVSFSYPGDCGGNVSFSGVHNNGDTGGSLNLNNFCMRDAATGASNVLNGRMSLNADGTPGQTGPITSAVSAESLGVVTLVRSTGESFSMELTGLNYRYGRPGQVPTLAQQDKLTVEEFVIRNNTTGQTTKIDVVEADIGYRSPVPTTSTRGSGTVEVTGSMDVFFPNAGKVSVETLPGQPLVIDRSRSEIKSVGLEVVGAGGKSATFTVSESNPGVFVVSMSDPAFAGASVDCSELRLENQFQIIEQLADRVGSGF